MSIKRYNVMSYSIDAEGFTGPFVKHEDHLSEVAKLQSQLTALTSQLESVVAELSAVLTDRAVILEDLDNTCFEIGMMLGEKSESYPVPVVVNHDAFLAEVRASGVEMFADMTAKVADEEEFYDSGESSESLKYTAKQARLFAAQLRQGGAV